jgi:hypothetical protein
LVSSAFANLTKAYAFGGANLSGAATSSGFKDSDLDLGSESEPVTYEFWVKPQDLAGSGIIWETGAASGAAVYYDAGTVGYNGINVSDGPMSYAIADVSDFYQVVVVVTNDGMTMWVNGVGTPDPSLPVSTSTSPQNGLGGGNASGLGNVGGNVGGYVPEAARNVFEGEIALARLYTGAMSGAEVEAAYNAIIPEPATSALLIMAFGAWGLLRRWR